VKTPKSDGSEVVTVMIDGGHAVVAPERIGEIGMEGIQIGVGTEVETGIAMTGEGTGVATATETMTEAMIPDGGNSWVETYYHKIRIIM